VHYLVYVIHQQAELGYLDELIYRALSPFRGEKLDFWQIGGRWTGRFTGYNPEADLDNQEPCRLCKGTGTRQWAEGARPCNGCDGKGIAVLWPLRWKRHEGDTQPILAAIAAPVPHAAVTPDGEWLLLPEDTPENARARWEAICRAWPLSYVTIVDVHH
jgi:hypothetical protein